jgi:hypothetical protein
MATRNYDFAGIDRHRHSFHPSERISEHAPVLVPGGEDEDGITDAGDLALDEAARQEAIKFLTAWPEQSAVDFWPSGQPEFTQRVEREIAAPRHGEAE